MLSELTLREDVCMTYEEDYCPHYDGKCPNPKIEGGCWACEWYDYE